MFVYYYMTPSPVTISPELPVIEALNILEKHEFRHLPVVDDNGCLQGMLTDRDLRSAGPSSMLTGAERELVLDRVKGTEVCDIMSADLVRLNLLSTLDDALLKFRGRSVGAMPVVDEDDRVKGIFSLNDMMAAYRSLFGLGEKGSALVAVEDHGIAGSLSRLMATLEEHHIPVTRLIRTDGSGREPAMIYLRVNSCNLPSVHGAVKQAGFTVHIPEIPT